MENKENDNENQVLRNIVSSMSMKTSKGIITEKTLVTFVRVDFL